MAHVSGNQKMGNNPHRFLVTVQRQQVEEFNKVISRSANDDPVIKLQVPLTFPATWYGLDEVQSRIMEETKKSIGSVQFVLLHLEQTIEMFGQLEVDQTYKLDIQVGELNNDGKFKVSAEASDLQEVPLASMTSLFAVVTSKEGQP